MKKLEQGDAEDAAIIAQEGDGANDIPEGGLSELDINKAMNGHRAWLGTIAADEINLLKPGKEKRVCWIMNTDPRGKAGTHWVAFLLMLVPMVRIPLSITIRWLTLFPPLFSLM